MVVAIMLLTTRNSWAVAAFAKKFGIGCKSCHAFGSELNELGVVFKKNGHTFGEKNAATKNKPKQSTAKVDRYKALEALSKSSDKPESVNSEKTEDSEVATASPETEQPPPETTVYSWKADDGTLHFSDAPYAKPARVNKTVLNKKEKKILQSRLKPLSAIVPKLRQKAVSKKTGTESEKIGLPRDDSPGTAGMIEIRHEIRPKSFEECMEQILVANPSPSTSEATMELFREAETICLPYDNTQKR